MYIIKILDDLGFYLSDFSISSVNKNKLSMKARVKDKSKAMGFYKEDLKEIKDLLKSEGMEFEVIEAKDFVVEKEVVKQKTKATPKKKTVKRKAD